MCFPSIRREFDSPYSHHTMSKKFIKKRENFTCEHCGIYVVGDGVTNHCPRCLYSKHVDIFPGDRLEGCAGLMKPVSFVMTRDGGILTHRCIRCNVKKKNKLDKNDNFEVALAL